VSSIRLVPSTFQLTSGARAGQLQRDSNLPFDLGQMFNFLNTYNLPIERRKKFLNTDRATVDTIGNAAFGRTTGPQVGTRIITMGLRLEF